MSHARSRILDDMASHVDFSAAVARRAFPPGPALPTPARSVALGEGPKRAEPAPSASGTAPWKYHYVTGGSETRPLEIEFPAPRSVHGIRVEGLKVHEVYHVSEGSNKLTLSLSFLDSPDGRSPGSWLRSTADVFLPVGQYTLDGLCEELEAQLGRALTSCYNPSYKPEEVAEILDVSNVSMPFYVRVAHTERCKRDAERVGEAWTPLPDFLSRDRWLARGGGGKDRLAPEVLELAQIYYRSNQWAWRDLADERDGYSRFKWPYHTLLHRLMAPHHIALPERIVISIHPMLHFDPETRKQWGPFTTVPTFTLDVPRGLQTVLGLPAGGHTSHSLTAQLPPLARYFDGRDHAPVAEGDQALPCDGDNVQCLVGTDRPLGVRGALMVNVLHGENHLQGRVVAAGVHGAACGAADGLLASPQLNVALEQVDTLRLQVVDEWGCRVDGVYTALVGVR